MANRRVGGEVDSLCTRCKLTLAHTIIAMVGEKVVRVQCNTCGGQHAFKNAPGSTSSPSKPRATTAAKSASAAVSKITVTFDQLLSGKDVASSRRYSPRDTYAKDEVIDHPNFGFGVVMDVRGDKVQVLFKMDEKTLIHGRGGAPASKPAFAPPRGTAQGPSDKPMASAEGEENAESKADGQISPPSPS